MNCQYVGKMEALLTLITDKLTKLDEHDRSLGYLLARLERQATIFDEFADACERMEQVIKENKRPDIIDIKKLADELEIHRDTARRLALAGKIPHWRVTDRGMYRFDRDEALAAFRQLQTGKDFTKSEEGPGRPA